MLNGIDPIIIFQFSKLAPSLSETIAKIPIISEIPTAVDMPPIPIYLSESLTGLYIDAESKSVDINTTIETKSDGSEVDVSQKGIGANVSIDLVGKKDSIGLSLLSAMIDLVFDKVSSKEYAITYLHGATTIFRGLLQSYQVNQNANNELLTIRIELSRGEKQPQKAATTPVVEKITGATAL